MNAISMNSLLPVLDVFPYTTACLLDELVLGLCCAGHGAQLEFGLPSELESPSTRPQGHALPHRGSSIDQGFSADATGPPAILLEDSRPQAILKLRPPNSLDYSTPLRLPAFEKSY